LSSAQSSCNNESSKDSVQSVHKDAANDQHSEIENKSWTTTGSIYEGLDESIINKNSFCIMLGAFIRRHAVSPKTVNLYEISMLLNSYKAMFYFLTSGSATREGESLITKAFDHKGSFSNDIVSFKDEINIPAVAQHLGMLTNLKAWSFAKKNSIHKCVKTLWIDEKDIGGKQHVHATCA